MDPLRHLEAEIDQLSAAGLLRQPPECCTGHQQSTPSSSAGGLVLCANDYLGYAAEQLQAEPSIPAGAGASRLLSGQHRQHQLLESALCQWLGTQAALVFSSGYAANVGLIAALAREGDIIISDEYNHASIVDGCRLSRAAVTVIPHIDLAAVERALRRQRRGQPGARRWVITESYFSMHATTPQLGKLRQLCNEFDAGLIVDEAHAIGVFGPAGRGLCAAAGIVPDVLVGTLGKALGLQGAFVAGSKLLRQWLWNSARSFVFSTGLSPSLAATATARVARIEADDEARARLHTLTARLRTELQRLDAPVGPASYGPIIPWFVGDPRKAVSQAARLLELGVYVHAIRPPSVPAQKSILRISTHAKLTDSELTKAVDAFAALLTEQ